jgi:GMP synthase (glutamine-hydrolysing)
VTEVPQGWVAIVDLGSQYGQLIARRVRELGVFSQIFPPHVSAQELVRQGARAVVLSGGPDSAYHGSARQVDPQLYRSGLAVLGICYGAQRMAQDLGGEVAPGEVGEFGPVVLRRLEVGQEPDLLADFPPEDTVWMSHADRVTRLPPGFRCLASTPGAPLAVFAHAEGRLWGVQFHPEVAHTRHGRQLLARFLFDVAGLSPNWRLGDFAQAQVEQLKARMAQGRAVVALSGGVDSAVAAVLAARAVGDRLTAVFVDHGLMREGEAQEVVDRMSALGVRLRLVPAKAAFLSALRGVVDPEEKRRIVGREFGRVLRQAAQEEAQGGARYLVQGTLYPDVVESGQGESQVIKTHHNVGGLPRDLGLEVVEPLRLLFKDEVREVGRLLGLPREVVERQPFPGPGLAVRIAGEVTLDRLEILRRADRIVREEVEAAGLAPKLFQYFAVLLPGAPAVGVQGDRRTYGMSVVVRAVTSEDAMTAAAATLPPEVLGRIASRIPAEVSGVTRVLYDLTTKPPGTIEWE